MNGKIKIIITNFSYTLMSNLISMIISTLIVIIVPKLIGVSEYGYWQLYIFYTSYLGFFNIGWVEGIYLRYGGEEYHRLNRNVFTSQFWSFCVYIIGAGSLITIYSLFYASDFNKQFILQMVSICLITSVPRGFLLYVLESTNRIKEYSRLTLLDRIIYCLIIVVMLMLGIREYKLLIIADLVGKIVTLIVAMYICKEIVFSKMVSLKDSFQEMIANISVGIKLMFANIASMLIIGVVRFGIERSWNVATFGKVSLTLSVSNLMMLFINAIGLIMFPILRRTDEKRLSSIYVTMRDFLMVILLGALIVYYPLKVILIAWLPRYADSLIYMALVFPMCVFEGKMALLINTYLKTLRKEKFMLKINLISLALSVIITFITTIIFKNLDLAITSIVVLLAFRCALSEMFLSNILTISLYKDIVLELIMTLIFILTGWFINSWLVVLLYAIAYIIYLVIKRKDIINAVGNVKLLMKG
ncbi:hypothetical protein LL037_24355 [Clostridium estertheticum]|uniref:lipopolysaccharide biosynthesis protein n=1 Tax=Clostridium estertheticum TaxID=238834 RepID=UPI001C0BC67D|nr:hypothetical protein [Clostridium estertheticum]MBU3197725.1 hypothetical protein [Clostridium estertheticum]WAG65529.1 hypothetical protein LL037_24355 [Clostridium estertheticum]